MLKPLVLVLSFGLAAACRESTALQADERSEPALDTARYRLVSVDSKQVPFTTSETVGLRAISLTAGRLDIREDRKWFAIFTYYLHDGGRLPEFYRHYPLGEYRLFADSTLSMIQKQDIDKGAMDWIDWAAEVSGSVITVNQDGALYRYERILPN